MKRHGGRKSEEIWYKVADEEASALLAALPTDLRDKLGNVTVTLEARPSIADVSTHDDYEDMLGVFVGHADGEELETTDPIPSAIKLFIENLREEVDDDWTRFRQEVRATLLHEIGHYLGLDEDDLTARGL